MNNSITKVCGALLQVRNFPALTDRSIYPAPPSSRLQSPFPNGSLRSVCKSCAYSRISKFSFLHEDWSFGYHHTSRCPPGASGKTTRRSAETVKRRISAAERIALRSLWNAVLGLRHTSTDLCCGRALSMWSLPSARSWIRYLQPG